MSWFRARTNILDKVALLVVVYLTSFHFTSIFPKAGGRYSNPGVSVNSQACHQLILAPIYSRFWLFSRTRAWSWNTFRVCSATSSPGFEPTPPSASARWLATCTRPPGRKFSLALSEVRVIVKVFYSFQQFLFTLTLLILNCHAQALRNLFLHSILWYYYWLLGHNTTMSP